MLQLISESTIATCDGVTRRQFMRIGAWGSLSLPWLLAARAQGSTAKAARDKSVVVLFLTGGPSQIETFDPKMTAPAEYRSVVGDVVTSLSGIALGGVFPQLAKRAQRLAIVRSFTHDDSDHTRAVEKVLRGGNTADIGMGAVASRLRGANDRRSGMPTHVYLSATEVDRQFNKERMRLLAASGAGELGGAYGPFQIGGQSPLANNLKLRVSADRLDDRLTLNRALDRLSRQIDQQGEMQNVDRFGRQALEMVLGKSRQAFDLSAEDPRLLRRYDTSRFITGISKQRPSALGKQMLLARRLCEAGCGFITIHNPGWDMHGGPTQFNMPQGMETLGRPVDHAVSVFLDDVHQRGLSEKILLIVTGEFGRTPRVKDNGGRDHWPRLSTLLLAGGGLQMGQVIGQSTAKAEEPQSDPVTLENLLGVVMHVLFDVTALRLRPDIPRDLTTLLDRSPPIRALL